MNGYLKFILLVVITFLGGSLILLFSGCTEPSEWYGDEVSETNSCEPNCDSEAVCPPDGLPGFEVGDTLTDINFLNCDGEVVSLHDLCGKRTGLIFNFYGW